MTDDEAARFAYLAEGNAKQARKRVATDVLITDVAGRVLLVDPAYKPDWDLPGGMVEENEPPRKAGERELREELGLRIELGRLLYLEWVPPHGPWDDTLMFIFDGGSLNEEAVAGLRPTDDELCRFTFASVEAARDLLRPYVWERLRRAVEARRSTTVDYSEPTSS
jgi:ADP-ribose pyrophosphatase YjhB (NUDIX family)